MQRHSAIHNESEFRIVFLAGFPLCEAKHRSAGQFLMLRAVRCTAWLGLAVSFGQDQEQETEPKQNQLAASSGGRVKVS